MKKSLITLLIAILLVSICGMVGCSASGAHTHNYTYQTIKTPSCSEDGVMFGVCSCGESLEKAIPATGHTFSGATCTEVGICSTCGVADSEPLGHVEVVDKKVDPTCTETGLTEGSHCSRCGDTLVAQEEIPALEHVVITDSRVEPTCTQTGLTEGSHCSRCGETLVAQETIPALKHVVVTDNRVEPTCTQTGLTEGSHCSRCGETLVAQEVIPALKHVVVTDDRVDPTCTQTGLTEGSHCSRCGDTLVAQETIPALKHVVVTDSRVEPTCTETGLTEGSHCSRCGDTLVKQEVTKELGHDVVIDQAIDPTCSTVGYTEGSHCLRCGETLVAQQIIDELPHKYENSNQCSACDYVDTQYFTFTLLENDTYSIKATDVNNIPAHLVIPSEYDGKAVTEIGASAFYYCQSLTSVAISSGVKTIGDSSFFGCYNLLSVSIPNSVKTIGTSAFSSCLTITTITIPASVEYIGEGVFSHCSKLTSIVVDKDNAFYQVIDGNLYSANGETFIQYALGNTTTNFVIPNHVTQIYAQSFSGAHNLNSIVISDKVTVIDSYTFSGCVNLKTVYISASVTDIDGTAFSGNHCLSNIIVDVNNTHYKDIDGNLYSKDGTKLVQYAIGKTAPIFVTPDNVSLIGAHAFDASDYLYSVYLPNSVVTIDRCAFYYCSNLTNVVIGNSTIFIANLAFHGCNNLTSVFYSGTEADWNRIDISYSNDCLLNATRYYYSETHPMTEGNYWHYVEGFAIPWCYSPVVDQAVDPTCTQTGLTEGSHCETCGEILVAQEEIDALPHTYENSNECSVCGYIDTQYFTFTLLKDDTYSLVAKDVNNLPPHIVIPSEYNGKVVTSIGYDAFKNCKIIEEITIPNSIIRVDSNAFFNCTNLAGVNYIGTIDQWVEIDFGGYSNPTEYAKHLKIKGQLVTEVILSTATKISNAAFYNCEDLTRVVISDTVKIIGNAAFAGCKNLSSILIGNNVTTIDDSAFFYCTSLTSIVIPEGVAKLGFQVFFGCYSLTSVTLPNSLTSIGNGIFDSCKNLNYTIEGGLKYLGNNGNPYLYLAGAVSKSITTCTINGNCRFIGTSAFGQCKSLVNINIPNSVTHIASTAFVECDSLVSVVIPDSVIVIGYGAFQECDNLTSIVIPNSVIETGAQLFWNCKSLETAIIGDGITTIQSYSFSGCNNLKIVVIPSGVEYISTAAFDDCDNLTSVLYKGDEEAWEQITIFSDNDSLTNATRYYYSEQAPAINDEGTAYVGNYWHYDANGEAVVWTLHIHTEVIDQAVAPTCTQTGLTQGSHCETCGEIFTEQEVVDALGHISGSALIENKVEPDCENTGKYDTAVYCKTCNVELSRETVTVQELGHNEITDNKVEPTCSKTGLTQGSHCGTCGKVLVAQEVVDALSHTYENSNVCSVCGYVNTQYFTFTLLPKGTYSIKAADANNIPAHVVIPSEYDGKAVTSISDYAFWESIYLTSIVIPDSVTSIGSSAFCSCHSLTSVIIPDSVISIGEEVFCYCYSLTSVVIPNSVITIGNGAFLDCDSLQYNVKNGLKYLGNNDNPYLYLAGPENENITTATVDNNCRLIGGGAFACCSSLTSVVIGDSVTEIGADAFAECDSLTSVVIPKSVMFIGDYAFCGCYNLTSVYYKGNDFEWLEITIGDYNGELSGATCYYYSEQAPDLNDKGTAYVGDYWHYDENGKLAVWVLHIHTEVIDQAVAPTCTQTGLTQGSHCGTCGKVLVAQEVVDVLPHTYENSNECSVCGYVNTQYFTFTLLSKGTYSIKATDVNNVPAHIVISSEYDGKAVTSIGDFAFYGCSLTSVVIPDGVTYIGEKAFAGCSSLTSVVIPDGVTSISYSAFSGCSSLTSVVIPDRVTYIGECAFDGCRGLTSVVIPDSVTEIGRLAFAACSSLTSVVIPDSVTEIGDYAFDGCSSLTSITVDENNANYKDIEGNLYSKDGTTLIQYATSKPETTFTIPDSVTEIGSGAFSNCSSLTSVVIPDSVTSIGSAAFHFCSSLTSVVIPDSVTTFGEEAFFGCGRLVEVINKSSHITVTKGSTDNGYVGYYALSVSNCDDNYVSKLSNDKGYIICTDGAEKILIGYNGNQTELVLPAYITQINQYAFSNCRSLTSVVIPDSVTEIGEDAFRGCSSLTSVVIPDSVTTIGNGAFYDCRSLTSIKYRGTRTQWSKITKGTNWDLYTRNYTITYNYDGE